MSLKLVVGICVVVVVLQAVLGAPHSDRQEQDLRQSFIEFLQQDKELSSLLQNSKLELGSLTRVARQAENDLSAESVPEPEGGDDKNKPGFFDRAAKFVMEVLQRFLKWINTED